MWWRTAVVILSFMPASRAGERSQEFRSDPGWESFRSRLIPSPIPITRQDLGHRATRNAGGRAAGELGGWVQRSTRPSWVARPIPPRTFEQAMTASGTLAVTHAEGGSGALVGWFHRDSRGWRTPNSLAFRIDGNGGKYWVLFEYGTRHGLTGGGATFEGRYQTTATRPFLADGTPHRWSLSYDPEAANGLGEIRFTFDDQAYAAPLDPGHKGDGAEFDRFGIFNQQITGDGLELYIDDLEVDGEAEAFDRDPNWEARDHRVSFPDRVRRPYHDFGFSPTAHAGGEPGELGGILWRDEAPAYYADEVPRLSLDHPLSASGRLVLRAGAADSAAYLGWLSSVEKQGKATPEYETPQRSLIGLLIEGPSRVGHYVRPVFRDASGAGGTTEEGPILRPDGQPHRFAIAYRPDQDSRGGRLTVRLDDQERTLNVSPEQRARGAVLDRFGLFNLQSGGHHVELYLDDLSYTAGP